MRIPMRSSSRERRARRDSAYGITTAENSQLDDITRRQRQYAFTMLFRIVAILVVVFVPGLTVLERMLLGIVATVIPYFAVIRANAGPENADDPTNLMIGGPRQHELPGPDRGLEAGPRRVDADGRVDVDEDGFGVPAPDDETDAGLEADEADEPDEPVWEYVVHDDDPRESGPDGRAADHHGHSHPDTP